MYCHSKEQERFSDSLLEIFYWINSEKRVYILVKWYLDICRELIFVFILQQLIYYRFWRLISPHFIKDSFVKMENSNIQNKMPFMEAIVLSMFGIILPTWDVWSDVSLSYKMMVPKICSWDDYVENYFNGIEPSYNFEIGNLIWKKFQ